MENIQQPEPIASHHNNKLILYLHSPQRYYHTALALLGTGVLVLIINLLFDLVGIKPGLIQISLVAGLLVSGLYSYQKYLSLVRLKNHTPEG